MLDYLFLKLGQGSARADIAPKATPELLFLLAHDDEAPAELRLAAAERAASLNVIDGETLVTREVVAPDGAGLAIRWKWP